MAAIRTTSVFDSWYSKLRDRQAKARIAVPGVRVTALATCPKPHLRKPKAPVMNKITTRPWDSAEHLKTDEDIAAYLDAVLEEAGDDTAFIAKAIGTVARARGMTQLANDTGLAREALYRALSPTGNPNFGTVLKVLRALGVQLHAAPVTAS
jgi:probable addiction module antidote protein